MNGLALAFAMSVLRIGDATGTGETGIWSPETGIETATSGTGTEIGIGIGTETGIGIGIAGPGEGTSRFRWRTWYVGGALFWWRLTRSPVCFCVALSIRHTSSTDDGLPRRKPHLRYVLVY